MNKLTLKADPATLLVRGRRFCLLAKFTGSADAEQPWVLHACAVMCSPLSHVADVLVALHVPVDVQVIITTMGGNRFPRGGERVVIAGVHAR